MQGISGKNTAFMAYHIRVGIETNYDIRILCDTMFVPACFYEKLLCICKDSQYQALTTSLLIFIILWAYSGLHLSYFLAWLFCSEDDAGIPLQAISLCSSWGRTSQNSDCRQQSALVTGAGRHQGQCNFVLALQSSGWVLLSTSKTSRDPWQVNFPFCPNFLTNLVASS